MLQEAGYEYVLDHGTYGDEFWIMGEALSTRLGIAETGGRSMADVARVSYGQWKAVIHSPHWSLRRAGVSNMRKKSNYNCCGVPAMWVDTGVVPPDFNNSTSTDLVAPGRKCSCPY